MVALLYYLIDKDWYSGHQAMGGLLVSWWWVCQQPVPCSLLAKLVVKRGKVFDFG